MKLNRRSFLKTSAGAVATIGVAPFSGCFSITRGTNLNSRLQHACIGVGNMGNADLKNLRTHSSISIVGLCDVDSNYLGNAAALEPQAGKFVDWREMLSAIGDKVDSVNVATPDHNHTQIVCAALRAGKHVYAQKPLCQKIDECRLIERHYDVFGKPKGLTTQLGMQRFAYVGDRMTVKYLRDMAIGEIKGASFFSLRDGRSRVRPSGMPAPASAPKTLAWDQWIGTAEFRPYVDKWYHPLIWRIWHDFGTSWLGDIGTHLMCGFWDGVEFGRAAPLDVIADVPDDWRRSGFLCDNTWPMFERLEWTFPGNKYTGGKPIKLKWRDGFLAKADTPARFLPDAKDRELAARAGFEKFPEESLIIEGSDGWIVQQLGKKPHIVMKGGRAAPPAAVVPEVPSHWHEYVDACVDGHTARTSFDWTTRLMETVLVGTVAMRNPGKLLKWDPVKVTLGDPAADALFHFKYRKGWEIPAV